MNKNELIATVANSTGLSKSQSAEAIEAVIDTVTAQLRSGSDVRLVGFGTFSISRRQATTGRNPRTGETINIAASNVPKLKQEKL